MNTFLSRFFRRKEKEGIKHFRGVGFTQKAAEQSVRMKVDDWKRSLLRNEQRVVFEEEEMTFKQVNAVNTVCHLTCRYRIL